MVAATVIDQTNFLTQSRQNVVSLLDIRTNVADPITSSAGFRKMVYSREPDTNALDFAHYPYVIVHPAVFSQSRNKNVRGTVRLITWSVEVEIVTSDRAFNNREGQGLADLDSMSDDVCETLHSTANRNTLRTNNLFNVTCQVGAVSDENNFDTRVYRRSILVTMDSQTRVTA